MDTSERRSEHPERHRPRGGGDPSGDSLAAFREAGERFWSAAGDAIQRSLSRNSVTFLGSRQQATGQ